MAYQSFGSYGSFKFTPDLGRSRKILQAREEERRGQVEYNQQLKQQQNSYLEYMRQKLRDEQANRDRNFRLEQQQNQQVAQAYKRIDDANIQNLELKAQQSETLFKQLGDFSQTLGKAYIDQKKKAEEKQYEKDKRKEAESILNLSPEEQLERYKVDASNKALLRASDTSMNGIANAQAESIGNINVEELRQSALGSLSIGAQEVRLTEYGSNLDTFAEVNKDLTYNLIDPVTMQPLPPMTLEEAENRGGVIAQQAHSQLINKAADHFGIYKSDLKADFITKNFLTPAQNWSRRRLARSESARDKRLGLQAQERQSRDIAQSIYTAINQPGLPESRNVISTMTASIAAETNGKYVQPNGKPDYAYIRDAIVLPQLEEMVDSGLFDSSLGQVDSFLENQALVLNNGQTVPLSSIKNSVALNELTLKIKNREREIQGNIEQEEMSAAKDDVYALMGAAFEDGINTQQEIISIKKAMLGAYRDKPRILQEVNNIIDRFGVDDAAKLDKDQQFALLEQAGNAGTLTELEIQQNMNWLTKDQQKSLIALVDQFNPSSPSQEGYKRSDIEKAALGMFRQKLGALDLGKGIDPSVNWAVTEVGDYYVAQFKKLQSDPNLTLDQIAVEARKNTMDYLSAGMSDPDNPFYVVEADKSAGTQGYVKNFKSGNYSIAQTTNTAQQIKDINSNPSLLSTQVYLSNRYLADIEGDIKNGRMITYTPWVNQIASITNQQPFEVINQQLAAAKSDQKIEPGSFDKLNEVVQISPKLKAMLAEPTSSRVNAAIIGSDNAPGTVRRGRDGEQDVMQLSKLSGFRAPPLAAAMWAIETGRGKTVHGPNALFNIKSKDGTGTTTTTREFINGQWISQTATWANYKSPLESAQALTDWANNAPGFKEAKTYRQAIEAIANAGYATDPEYVPKVLRVLNDMGYNPDDPIIEHKGTQATNPNSMSPTLRTVAFYRTGDVMAPGMAPSEHLDIKQVDNPNTREDESNAYFEADALDNYVEVDDPKFGKVGPEELTDKFYGKGNRPESMGFYAPRKYRNGTHLGWDYPTANGSTLHLKNGARVVGGYQTSFGYKAIIELPNGKRFSFLHGYKL